jgi:hypothetical protein
MNVDTLIRKLRGVDAKNEQIRSHVHNLFYPESKSQTPAWQAILQYEPQEFEIAFQKIAERCRENERALVGVDLAANPEDRRLFRAQSDANVFRFLLSQADRSWIARVPSEVLQTFAGFRNHWDNSVVRTWQDVNDDDRNKEFESIKTVCLLDYHGIESIAKEELQRRYVRR